MSIAGETSSELLASALAALGPGHASARLEAEVLLAHALDTPRARLHAWPEEPVPAKRAARFRELVARRAGGEPVAYLTGTREFWSLALEVTRETLIPRPETERLVEVALGLIAADRPVAVADLGTGSGAVAAAIARERPRARIVATDISAEALAVAARNLRRLGIGNVRLRRGDWLEALAGERFTLIVCNPPYVASHDPHLASGDVRFEPTLALEAGDDGLTAIRRIVASAAAHLAPGAALVLEHGHDQGPAVRDLFLRHGYRDVRGHTDLGGNDRVVVGFR